MELRLVTPAETTMRSKFTVDVGGGAIWFQNELRSQRDDDRDRAMSVYVRAHFSIMRLADS